MMKKGFLLFALVLILTASTKRPLTWVAIGDSITYLNDHPDETGNRITKGYMTMVTDQLPHIHCVNQGHNGWTSGGIAASIDTLGLVKADVYSVFLGTNDWWQGRPLGSWTDYQHSTGNATVYGSFRLIINKIRSLNQTARIILITPMQRTDFVYIANYTNNAFGSYQEKKGQSLAQFADAIRQIGRQEGFEVVDLYHTKGMEIKNLVKYKRLKNPQTGQYTNYPYPKYIEVPFSPQTDEYPYPVDAIDITYDGLHPSDKGYKIISDRLVKILGQY